ncbi:uncharacterized protein DUF4255 [Chitinophaga skermanii]|uniref:Uncharacterized protein DUF4255 n=1 Tax=Chitinophaga skermanii TaxID=331697 RepID=A0A327QSW5_9BACT|nr:DUF4255 domain-containing protein [Chitinophaga skermanii]RAJ06503.1 uncharacterized protein DUF4255 [Chitinophaga skermanii]
MIFTAFKLLRDQLDSYIQTQSPSADSHVVLDNVATLETPDRPPGAEERVILSMVNIEEEATLKNGMHFSSRNQSVAYSNPPLHLNLYMLVSANYKNYEDALLRLSQVLQFFQGKNSFTLQNSPSESNINLGEEAARLQLILELFSLSFEQLNHLWGALGGKQMPSVLYKVRQVTITENRTIGFGTIIEEIHGRENLSFSK